MVASGFVELKSLEIRPVMVHAGEMDFSGGFWLCDWEVVGWSVVVNHIRGEPQDDISVVGA